MRLGQREVIEQLRELALYSSMIVVGWFVLHIIYWRNNRKH